MTWLLVLVIVGVLVTLTLWAMFVYIAVRGTETEIPDASFGKSRRFNPFVLVVDQGAFVVVSAERQLLTLAHGSTKED